MRIGAKQIRVGLHTVFHIHFHTHIQCKGKQLQPYLQAGCSPFPLPTCTRSAVVIVTGPVVVPKKALCDESNWLKNVAPNA